MPKPHNIKFCHVLGLIWELRSLAINIPYPVTRPCHHLALPLLWNMELWNSTLTATLSPSLPYTFTPPIFSLNKALDFNFPSNHPSPLGFKDTPTIRPSPHLPDLLAQPACRPSVLDPAIVCFLWPLSVLGENHPAHSQAVRCWYRFWISNVTWMSWNSLIIPS